MSRKYDIIGKDKFPPDKSLKALGSAGCGKSSQSEERLSSVMKKHNLDYNDITVCTYRTTLANELFEDLQERGLIDQNINRSDTYIGTIHAICKRLIENELDIQVNNFISYEDKKEFCKQYSIEYKPNEAQRTEGEVLFNILSYMSNTGSRENIPDDKQKDLDDVIGWNCNELWTKWQSFKDEKGDVWEFYELLEIVRDNNLIPPNNFLLIDEMHDAYPLLNDVVQEWIENTKQKEDGTVIVAGDPYQVINSYQGADPKYFNETDLPELILTKTFRCPEHVWDYATTIINKEFDIHDVEPQSDEGELIDVDAATLYQEDGYNEWKINDNSKWTPHYIINEYMDENNEVMFLVRTRSQIEAIGQQLDKLGIMYNGQFSRSWTDSDHLDIYNVLQKINMYINDAVDVVITKDELQTILHKLPSEYITNTTYSSVFVSDLDTVFTEEFISMDFTNIIEELRITNSNKTRIKRSINRYNNVMDKNSIQVSIRTIHESKGMEAENVVLYDSITNRIQNKMDTKKHIKESECRTWFVAATRSSKNLIILRDGFQKYPSTNYLPET